MRKFALVIPIMLIVAAAAMWMLKRDYSEIEYQTRVLLSGGAAVFSGVISFFLFKSGEGKN
ncbi:histidine kinase [Bacillus sp. DTU_2020_1000418_1_SI_GHA_SEK_038]|uniref:histidine kinase n=1 Tax=Bacillus sp. DTU_2020_1000418_1_SI_GHA_SEK_038 TaxID=3077585 RepID=UPI0028E217E4|nr:histidine kinase [Bacillus sp. DTU_2020_1000418_1_SI_GHA_SEK_038]WNS76278.1 histidine kinase [Bacillus sp. DTU_2020_1000418_1_SI_GHA_SEK_038]